MEMDVSCVLNDLWLSFLSLKTKGRMIVFCEAFKQPARIMKYITASRNYIFQMLVIYIAIPDLLSL
jgi:hypothetical protein